MTELRSSLVGVVSMFYVEEGAQVEEGERVLQLESMKTVFDILSPATGIVRYKCQLGQVVKRKDLLAEII